MGKGKSRFPGPEHLLKEEEHVSPKDTMSSSQSMWKEYEEYKSSERGSIVLSGFDIELDEDVIEKAGGRSSTIFSRDPSFDARLEDFVIKKVIGKGAFGKVFMVENKKSPG